MYAKSSRSLTAFLLAFLILALLGAKYARKPLTTAATTTGPTPTLSSYPDSTQNLIAMRDRRDEPAIRAHGWAILLDSIKGRSTRSGVPPPAWDDSDWEGKCTLGLAPGVAACGVLGKIPKDSCSPPAQTKRLVLDAPLQQFGGAGSPLALSSVRYSPSAAAFIRSNCLNTSDGLTELAARELGSGAANPDNQFPRDAKVVKLIWGMPDSNGQISAWDSSMVHRGDPADQIFLRAPNAAHTLWTKEVTVNIDETLPCSSRNYKYVGSEGYDAKTDAVPINCFYHQKVNCDQIQLGVGEFLGGAMHPCEAGQPKNPEVVLLGVHIITAELSDWVWSTFWWTAHPDTDPLHTDQPAEITNSGPWSFYSMDSTMSVTMPADPIDNGPKIVFNPYLEGPNANGPVSNCMFCHQMAVYRKLGEPSVSTEIPAGSPRRCAYLNAGDATCQQNIKSDFSGGEILLPNEAYFKDATPTHFLWSLAIAQDHNGLRIIQLLQSKKMQSKSR